jgi:hypothetical protein
MFDLETSGFEIARRTQPQALSRGRNFFALGAETLWALGLGVAVFLFHAAHIPAVTRGAIFKKSNLAFDFDINRFVNLWCISPFPRGDNEAYYAVRHPLAVSVRLVCMPMVQAGLDPHFAACGIAAVCAALSVMLIFRIARAMDVQTPAAITFALLWSVSTTTFVLGVLPEAYGLALVALTYQFLLTTRWVDGNRPGLAARLCVAVANSGITITNIILSGLAELICRIARQPLRKAIYATGGFSLGAGVIAALLSVASLSIWPSAEIDSPKNAVRQVYWSAAAYNADQRQGVANVAWEFAVTAFVAPAAARFPSGVPENPYLWDFRGQNYSTLGWVAVAAWLSLLVYGITAAFRDRERWPLWGIAAAWIVFNIGLHSYWQFRGSVFIYAGHPHIAFLMLALAGAPRVRSVHAYAAVVGLVGLLMAINNLPAYLQLSQLN